MAQFNISFNEHVSLIALLKSGDNQLFIDNSAELQRILKRLQQLEFNAKTCAWCGKEFEATNPRKTTCSDACRQALSRSKRAKPAHPLLKAQPAAAASHTPDVTPKPQFKVLDHVWLRGYEDDPEPLGTVQALSWMGEAFTNDDGTVTYEPQWVYDLGSDVLLPEVMLVRKTA